MTTQENQIKESSKYLPLMQLFGPIPQVVVKNKTTVIKEEWIVR